MTLIHAQHPATPEISIRASDGVMTVGGASVKLSRKEQVIAEALWAAWPGTVTRAELLVALGYNPACDTHVDATHLCRLRKKLEPAGVCVVNNRLHGYCLVVTP